MEYFLALYLVNELVKDCNPLIKFNHIYKLIYIYVGYGVMEILFDNRKVI